METVKIKDPKELASDFSWGDKLFPWSKTDTGHSRDPKVSPKETFFMLMHDESSLGTVIIYRPSYHQALICQE